VYLAGGTSSYGAGNYDMVLIKYSIEEKIPSDELIMVIIIIVSIANVVGIGIVITYFNRKRGKIAE
jgi:hypothetical protein